MIKLAGWMLFGALLYGSAALAQPGTTSRPGPYLFVLDLAGTPLDEFPDGVKALNGTMTVVDKNGQHMLRASSPSELLIPLPQPLPSAFTVEVDLVPKSCSCNPDDFMMEGTPTRNRGVASVELTWQPAHLSAVGGGGEMYQAEIPADLAALTPGSLTHLVMEFNGTTMKLYTNGRRLYTLDKQFVRGRVLRVWLGGTDEGLNAVYLAGLRIGTGPAAPGMIAGTAGVTGVGGGAGVPSGESGLSSPTQRLPVVRPTEETATTKSGLGEAGTVTGPAALAAEVLSYAAGGYGVKLEWTPVPNAVSYRMYRAQSGSGTGLSGQPITFISTPTLARSGYVAGVDPTVIVPPSLPFSYTYWVDARLADGTVSSSSPTVTVTPATTAPRPGNLRAVVSPTASVLVTNLAAGTSLSMRGGSATMSGSNVSWTWDVLPMVFGYEVRYEVVDAGTTLVLGRERLTTTTVPPVTLSLPYTKGIPAGKTVRFCVSVVDPDPANTRVAPYANCVESQTPAVAEAITFDRVDTRGTLAGMSSGPAPTDIFISGGPSWANLDWSSVTGATGYEVSRAVAGTTNWTKVTATRLTSPRYYGDALPDFRQTYTYRVEAYQADGRLGTATKDYTPPAPSDPTSFTAMQSGDGEVQLGWNGVAGVSRFLLSGPGVGTGGTGMVVPFGLFTVKGLAPGTYTWTVASSYEPGGVLTSADKWPKVTLTVGLISGRYRVTLLGFNVDANTYELGQEDGRGDEVFLAAVSASRNEGTGVQGAKGVSRTLIYGDILGHVPRVEAGTLTGDGGLKTGDAYPLSGGGSFPSSVSPQTDRLPMLLWEGRLTNGADVVLIMPSIWESDVGQPYADDAEYQHWVEDLSGSLPTLFDDPIVRGEIVTPGLRAIAGPPRTLAILHLSKQGHPIGVKALGSTAPYDQQLIVLTRGKIESVLSASQTAGGLAPGTVTVRLKDAVYTENFAGAYTLYLRVERVP